MLTGYIANRASGGLRKLSAIYQHRQIVDLAHSFLIIFKLEFVNSRLAFKNE